MCLHGPLQNADTSVLVAEGQNLCSEERRARTLRPLALVRH